MSFNNTNTSGLNADSIPDISGHHMHREDEPLPTHATRATDYSTEAIERGLPGATATSDPTHTHSHTSAPHTSIPHTSGTAHHDSRHAGAGAAGTGILDRPEFTSPNMDGAGNERLNRDVHHHEDPVTGSSTGPGAGHTTNPAATKVGFGDKIIGKATEVAGKIGHNAAMQEKGEIRRTEGKAGVEHYNHNI
jgi:hypothetical protein